VLVQLGAQLSAQSNEGETPLQASIRFGQLQAEQVLRQLLRTHNATAQHAPEDMQATAAASQTSGCAACGDTRGTSGAALKTCARCHSVKYCSVTCQRTHWRVHKPSCVATASGSRPAEQPAQEHGRSSAAAATPTAVATESEQSENTAPPQTTQHVEQAVPAAEATSSTQQAGAHPQPAGGSSKKAKDNQRKERQRQRKIQEATETLDVAMAAMEQSGVRWVNALQPSLTRVVLRCLCRCVLTIRGRASAARARRVRWRRRQWRRISSSPAVRRLRRCWW